ncbi:MAG: tetratricopeptide repeat protein [Deltaproteobacteria bacterium]|nr:tetratricopeptide repeat protein [Deltaproteobacteria bacterium]
MRLSDKYILAILVFLTVLVYTPIYGNDFVNWDDPQYFTKNLAVQNFNWNHLLTKTFVSNYHPLTMLSLALDNKIFGQNPLGPHCINLILHIVNALLVYYLVLCLPSTSRHLSFWLALIFAIHPLHVESVAWLSERKDVLSTFLFLGGLVVYAKQHPIPPKFFLSGKYYLVLLLFFLALNAKSMAVTFPLVLFLLDYIKQRKLTLLSFFEKLPFFVLSIIYGLVNIWSQSSKARAEKLHFDIFDAISGGTNSLVLSLSKSLFPTNLSVIYQRGAVEISGPEYLVAFVISALVIASVLHFKNKRKEIVWGALFFLLTFAPVSGVIPFGNKQIFADRYTYLPFIGLFYAYGVIVSAFLGNLHLHRSIISKVTFAILLLYAATFSYQSNQRVRVWASTETLMGNVVVNYPLASIAYCNLGAELKDKGDYLKAMEYLQKAIIYNHNDHLSYNNLGIVYYKLGQRDFAIKYFEKAAMLAPRYANPIYNLANVYRDKGEPEKALFLFNKAITIDPQSFQAFNNLGILHLSMGAIDEAIAALSEAIKINPKFFLSHLNLAKAYQAKGLLPQALFHYQTCLKFDPQNAEALSAQRALRGHVSVKY